MMISSVLGTKTDPLMCFSVTNLFADAILRIYKKNKDGDRYSFIHFCVCVRVGQFCGCVRLLTSLILLRSKICYPFVIFRFL